MLFQIVRNRTAPQTSRQRFVVEALEPLLLLSTEAFHEDTAGGRRLCPRKRYFHEAGITAGSSRSLRAIRLVIPNRAMPANAHFFRNLYSRGNISDGKPVSNRAGM